MQTTAQHQEAWPREVMLVESLQRELARAADALAAVHQKLDSHVPPGAARRLVEAQHVQGQGRAGAACSYIQGDNAGAFLERSG